MSYSYDRREAATKRIKVKALKKGDRFRHPATPKTVLEVTWVGAPYKLKHKGRFKYMVNMLVKDPHAGIEERSLLSTDTVILEND